MIKLPEFFRAFKLMATCMALGSCTPALDPDAQRPDTADSTRILPSEFLGIALDKPLNIPVCRQERGFPVISAEQSTLPCSTLAIDGNSLRYRVRIMLDPAVVPPGLDDDAIVMFRKGLVGDISISAGDIRHEASALKTLRDTFGEPTTQHVGVMKNSIGGHLTTHSARWSGSNARVWFFGPSDQIPHSYVSLSSTKFLRDFEADGDIPTDPDFDLSKALISEKQ